MKKNYKISFLWIVFVLSFLISTWSCNCCSILLNDPIDPSKEPIEVDDFDCVIPPVTDYLDKEIEGGRVDNWVNVVSDLDDISIDIADIEAWEVDDANVAEIDIDTDITSNSDSEISEEYVVNDISSDEVSPTSVSLFLLLITCVLFLCSYLLLGIKKKS